MEKISPVKNRLIELAEYFDMSPNEFSLKIGKSRSFIKGITKEIGSDVLRNIYLKFENVNLTWVITGDGSMILDEDMLESKKNNDFIFFLKDENKKLQQNIKELNDKNLELIKENAILSTKLSSYEDLKNIENVG